MTDQSLLPPAVPGQDHSLTEAQEGLWYAQALDPANPILNTGQYLELTGILDLTALRAAVARTIRETEALHLRFRATPEGPVQWRHSEGPALTIMDLTHSADAETEARRLMKTDSDRPLNLAAEPVAAFTLFRLPDGRHLLYERIHHLACDGYGMVLITNRIGEHYSALVTGAPPPAAFPALARALEEDADYRSSPRRKVDRDWWRQTLADLPEVTGPAPGRAVSGHTFLRHSRWLSDALQAELTAFAARHRLTWPDVLTGLAGAYLARWSDGEVVLGVPFMARMGSKAARLPCTVMNVLPLRLTADEDALLPDWLTGVAKQLLQSRRHGRYRSEQLRRDLGLIGGARRLYGPLVNVQPFDLPPVFAGLEVGLHILGAGAVDDLTMTFRGDARSGLLFEIDANPDLYTAEEIAAHSDRMVAFLQNGLSAERLADVATATREEIDLQDARAEAARVPLPETTLTALIETQMAATPDAPAITFGSSTLTYAELKRRSDALAAELARLGAGSERIVAVALERSAELPVALVGILRAGAAYLPLDLEHPPRRIARILEMAAPVVVLTTAENAGLFPPGTPLLLVSDWPAQGEAPRSEVAADNMTYVIFTSGSTGEPKGVVIEHRAIVNRLLWMREHYGIGSDDRILQKTPATFDVSVWEFFLPLIAGAELVMAPPGAHRDPAAIAAAIRRHGITTLHFVPSMLSAFLAVPASEGVSLRRVFCSGEELTAEQRDRFHRRISAELHNLYGPTEAAVDVSYWPAPAADRTNPLPIGFPVWNTRLDVLDDRMRPVPPGLAGHLYLGGVQLARGYLGRPDLTDARFLADPRHPGGRLYATGDLARLRPDGAVVYLGRSDQQVKVRGLRIELGEIEAAIMATGLAREAVVVAREDHAGEKRLVTYLVPTDSYAPGALMPRLAAQLPAYMVPAAEVPLDALPVTANGKLDRKSLPVPNFVATGRPVQTPTETLLANLFAEVLHLHGPLPAEADFFALGGDSLLAVRLALRIEEETGRDCGLGTVFEHPVLSSLAAALDAARPRDDGLGPVLLLADGDTERSPLFVIHPAGGIAWGYRALARHIAPERRVWGLQHPGLDPDEPMPESLAALARRYILRVSELQPEGVVHLAGWSVGGLIAQEMAVALTQIGRETGLVALLDSYPADCWRDEPDPDPVAALRALLAIAGYDPEAYPELATREAVVAFLRAGDTALGSLPERTLDGVVRTVTDTNRLVRNHYHTPLPATITHIRAAQDHAGRPLRPEMWHAYAETLDLLDAPCLHSQMTSPEISALIGPELVRRIREFD
ncbi:enterobactin synthase [Haematobacter massiliensis]|uniref:Enterobactin synthase n=1 Tax=Haematobacter massiliensis TaxID=195105 RepID=A0A086Y5L9_9RHOB|nr:non-ribosomal peptide synthetase [Haematobacter massiliensis]KFI29569.1 enterobactin synthase [Haematobacter massiliensis]OWJ88279.1 non-ribosomal peptide synthetase [Haematobacter massiliensis]QBJ25634.1 non-ribosomal peptide synthetase [Haematobacter massiliensis]